MNITENKWYSQNNNIQIDTFGRPGPVFDMWLSMGAANGEIHYIYNMFSHCFWPRLGKDKKTEIEYRV